ncbi:response regulator [Flavobacteriaceae bacterium TP-CH-4]|uniref:Response regulator n=1 Tax=Pelagihabitans pacificus TaxID=2696054 RepID=A0A967AWN2_9FLAO|nr:response regulator [Pelagihabitans pacificus]NHF60508.1 response regulator [Pelagihabitans pacificus]
MDSILIVDDNRQVLEQLKELLSGEGYQVAFIPRSDFLRERLEKGNFDLLLLDINLPGKNGLDWLKEIKSDSKHKNLPVIMITAEDERDTLAKCFELGANDYIHKPINEVALKSRVRSAITTKRFLEQQLRLEKQKAMQSRMMMLSSQMNPHFVFNALASVQSLVMTQETEDAVNYLSEFAGLMRLNLENSLTPYISLSDEIKFIKQYLELERIRFQKSFSYNISVQVENPEDIMIPPMLLQPYLENAIIHGLGKLDRHGELYLLIQEENDIVKCTITDNGIGREAGIKYKPKKHHSVAMANIEARLEMLNAVMEKEEFSVSIVDLETKGRPTGTRVVLVFPNDLH